jgi:16S rRNA (cytosine967-C5)-methyltransferase
LTAGAEGAPSARQRAFEILRRVEESRAFATPLLEVHEDRIADPRDAALLHDTVLGVLRWQALLDHVIARLASRPPAAMDPEVRRALRIGAHALLFQDRVPAFAAVDTAVGLIKSRAPRPQVSFVNGVLRALARSGRDALPGEAAVGDAAALAVRHSHPEWWVRRKLDRLGWDRTVDLLAGDNRPAPTVLRPDLKRATPRELQARLAAEGVRTERCMRVPEALRVVSGPLRRSRVLREGRAWVQDEASQLVTDLFGRVLRPRVLDLCAAPGIKTLRLRESLPLPGAIVAVDRNPRRLRKLLENVARVGATEILVVAADAAADTAPLRGPFDHVLVDAPCSGTGTLRRHPEIRWRLRPEDLPALAERQLRILETAARLVASGGSVLYSVCSLEPEEGEQVVAAFLERHSEFDVVDGRERVGAPARGLIAEDGALRTSPVDAMDGFFGVVLARR